MYNAFVGQQFLSLLVRLVHGREEQDVEDDKRDAGYHVNKQNSEPERERSKSE